MTISGRDQIYHCGAAPGSGDIRTAEREKLLLRLLVDMDRNLWYDAVTFLWKVLVWRLFCNVKERKLSGPRTAWFCVPFCREQSSFFIQKGTFS